MARTARRASRELWRSCKVHTHSITLGWQTLLLTVARLKEGREPAPAFLQILLERAIREVVQNPWTRAFRPRQRHLQAILCIHQPQTLVRSRPVITTHTCAAFHPPRSRVCTGRSSTMSGERPAAWFSRCVSIPMLGLEAHLRFLLLICAISMCPCILHAVQEHASELVVENNAMARRIEQLEMHSDNLAQWVQHLNRVQEDAAMSGRPMRDGPMVMREEMADDHLMGRDAYDGPHRGYGPPGGGHAAEYGPPSPKRLYGADPMPRGGTISPEAPHRSSAGRMHPTHMLPHDVYDRHAMGPPPPMPPGGGHPGMAMAPGPPPPGHGPLFRGSPPMHHVHAGPSHGGPMPPPYGDGVMRGPPPPPGAGNRSFYSGGGPPPPPSHGYEHGGPMHAQHPPSPPVSDPRMLKRARNGY